MGCWGTNEALTVIKVANEGITVRKVPNRNEGLTAAETMSR
jgi:hypothetical protein